MDYIRTYLKLSDKGANASGEYPVFICVILNRTLIKRVPTKVFVKPEFWDDKQREIKQKYIHARTLNERLNTLHDDVKKIVFPLQNQQPLTKEIILSELKGKKSNTVQSFFLEYIRKSAKTNGAGTIKHKMSELNKLIEFDKDVTFSGITVQWLEKYENYWSKTLKADTTLSMTMRRFLEVLRAADKQGLFDMKSIARYTRPAYKNPERPYLTLSQTEDIWDLVISGKLAHDKSLVTIACFFLVECYSGIRFSDWGKFTIETITDKEGLKVRTTKTGEPIYARLDKSPRLKAVIDYIKENGLKFDYTGEYTNRQLKKLGKIIGLKYGLTTHIARHSSAVLLLNKGHNFEYVAEFLGVSLKTAHIYGKVTRVKMDRDYEQLGGL